MFTNICLLIKRLTTFWKSQGRPHLTAVIVTRQERSSFLCCSWSLLVHETHRLTLLKFLVWVIGHVQRTSIFKEQDNLYVEQKKVQSTFIYNMYRRIWNLERTSTALYYRTITGQWSTNTISHLFVDLQLFRALEWGFHKSTKQLFDPVVAHKTNMEIYVF